jgi:hypothetical protein
MLQGLQPWEGAAGRKRVAQLLVWDSSFFPCSGP